MDWEWTKLARHICWEVVSKEQYFGWPQVAGGQWPVSIIEEGEQGMLRRGTLEVEGGYEHSAQNHRGVAQSDNVHSKPMNCQ